MKRIHKRSFERIAIVDRGEAAVSMGRPALSMCGIVLARHYEYTYVLPGERFPRRAHTSDPANRNVLETPIALARETR